MNKRLGTVLIVINVFSYGSIKSQDNISLSNKQSPNSKKEYNTSKYYKLPFQLQKTPNSIVINVKNKEAKFTICSDNVVRFQYYSKGAKVQEDPHLSVPISQNIDWEYAETESGIKITTRSLKVIYNTIQNQVSYFDKRSRKLILTESANSKYSEPISKYGEDTISVAQSFKSVDGEFLSGLGFYNQNDINFRGRYVYLCQDNAVSAIPFLISSHNYGILWNNASVTEFNPEKIFIPQFANNNDSSLVEGDFIAQESGLYSFVIQKEDNAWFNKTIYLQLNDSVMFNQASSWDGSVFSVKAYLKRGEKYHLTSKGGYKLYCQLPSAANTYTFKSELADGIDYHFIYGKNTDDVISGYRNLTGRSPMMPKWAFGFFQSKERYHNQQEIIDVVEKYRKNKYPLDVIVQDWEYWGKHGWNALRFDTSNFSDIKTTLNRIHTMHAKVMISVWPNFGDEKDGALDRLSQFKSLGFLTERSPITAAEAPAGRINKWYNGFYDVMNPAARSLFWSIMDSALFKNGIDAWWLDASEPRVNGFQGGWRYCSTAVGPAGYWTNLYPLLHSKGVYEGQRAETNQKRVFALGRTAYTGIQKYGTAVWTGDTKSSWQVFKYQIANGINASYSGLPYHSSDIGGFSGLNNMDSDHRELYTRWFQFGAFCPIFRAHGASCPREIWQFGKESEAIQLNFINLRYRLLPYIYSLAADVTYNNGNIVRGFLMDFPDDNKAVPISDQYMFGKSLMVAPVTKRLNEGGNLSLVYLPKGTLWYDFWTGEKHSGGQSIEKSTPLEILPLFVKAGSIIPMGPFKQYSTEKQEDPIELRVYTGANADFVLYEDENENYNYEKGKKATIPFRWDEINKTLVIGKRVGQFSGMLKARTFNIVFVDKKHGVGVGIENKTDKIIIYSGEKKKIRL